MTESTTPTGELFVDVGALRLCFETFGPPQDQPLLLIMGLGAQMIVWEDDFCRALAARGFHVVRFDNRDVGRSSRIAAKPVDVMAALLNGKTGAALGVPYLLKDMAADAVGLLEKLGIKSAHIVGASMGGMIAQEMAIRFPDHVKSLVSIMSTTGQPGLPPPKPEALAILMQPAPTDLASYVEWNVRAWRVLRGPGFPEDEAKDATRAELAFRRGVSAEGTARQFGAIVASGSRREKLTAVRAPTLVIHGAADPLVPLAGGEATAQAIPGARLLVIPGMGHAIPKRDWPAVIDAIAANAERTT